MAETKHRFEALTGGWLLEAYGMTETMLAAVVCPVTLPYKEGSIGIPLPDVDVRIVDVDTGEQTLPPRPRSARSSSKRRRSWWATGNARPRRRT